MGHRLGNNLRWSPENILVVILAISVLFVLGLGLGLSFIYRFSNDDFIIGVGIITAEPSLLRRRSLFRAQLVRIRRIIIFLGLGCVL